MQTDFEKAFSGIQNQLNIPDLWQQEAMRALREGKDLIIDAPTGAGKTFVFESLVRAGDLPEKGEQAVYTVPTRALANDKFQEWQRLGWKVGITTGDVSFDAHAPIIIATLETQREAFLSGSGPSLLVIDEYQMLKDPNRGLNYELALALAPAHTQLLLMSGSVSNPQDIVKWLERLGRDVHLVRTKERPVPLDELPLENLPQRAPESYTNYWQRLAVGSLLSQLGPLLIFASHRKAAEKIAKKIAEVLPLDSPFPGNRDDLRQAGSAQLMKLIDRRVAYHHSGLSFIERAGIIEPLAKAGQLRVVVATMGLAAGINFSMRSVFVSDTIFQDGPFERNVPPDELLQMFGRAGRRGLDTHGYVICGRKSPRLTDGFPLPLRRQNQIDWPTILRRMQFAVETEQSPFALARELRDRLFSDQKIPLGFRITAEQGDDTADGESLFGLQPTRQEIKNSKGDWERRRKSSFGQHPLAQCQAWIRGRFRPATGKADLIKELLPPRFALARLDAAKNGPRVYGGEISFAVATDDHKWRLNKWASKKARQLGYPNVSDLTAEEVEGIARDSFAETFVPGQPAGTRERGNQLLILSDFSAAPVEAYQDSHQALLIAPLSRTQNIEGTNEVIDETSGETFSPAAGTPAAAMLKLGLIDSSGAPTERGHIASFFQGGEGLCIAAALEEPDYELTDLIRHLANIRAGSRFRLDEWSDAGSLMEEIASERLAAACRGAYGPVEYDGYLRFGLPLNYGENAAEVLLVAERGELHRLFATAKLLDFGYGDVDRALVEWYSLLRHISRAPALPENARWTELQELATAWAEESKSRHPLDSLPEIPASVLQKPPVHGLPRGRFIRG